ncbi:serine/threonine protein phosphatase [Streptomyces tateyamensis]|uniref:Serine/threonine protein phosphatase n=1 Tax=Streptomyces tateyamensis TaxID=565073 RepID=A0A2V4N625_9ACTN|nr:serine/threonine protein phosphatase [Streptomyces tateyamensis]
MSVWLERRPQLGEDAEPLVLHHRPSGSGLLAVFDGSGGSGSSAAWQDPRGHTRTGAWVGSRVARLGAERWFAQHVEQAAEPDAESLQEQLRDLLTRVQSPTRSKVIGSMRRQLPTTMAAISYRPQTGSHLVEALWAGDSRGYVLRPETGLHPLTRDHTEETDALVQLTQDPPMTNVLSADRAFVVATSGIQTRSKCVMICATDGFFGYVSTPADFELHLLTTLAGAGTMHEWAQALAARVATYTGDDASLALVAVGYPGFDELRATFTGRTHQILAWLTPRPDPDDQERMRQWREQRWAEYRTEYEKFMPPIPVPEEEQ